MDLKLPRLRNPPIEKNAYDRAIVHRRDAYREDSFDLDAILEPSEYYSLISFLLSPGGLYLEYIAYNSINSQFPVTISQLPKCPDDLHEFPTKIKFSLESRYIGSSGYIDFGIIIITDFDETVNPPNQN
ncbi:hypothetical protein MASR2M64_12770 [Candidatus Cloacimonadota bacterium]